MMKWNVLFWVGMFAVGCTSPNNNSLPKPSETRVEGDVVRAAELGEELFFSPILSLDSSISCASCHIPAHGFADTAMVSMGVHSQSGFRNTPSIYNVAYKDHFFAEGGVKTLERATLSPMVVEEEMSLQAPQLMARIASNPALHNSFVSIYGDDYDYKHVVQSLVAYQHTKLRSFDSDWDDYSAHPESAPEAWTRGKLLFESDRLQCSTCHVPPLFTDQKFYDLGMPLASEIDYGKGRLTFDTADFYTFPTAAIRNVTLTAPYMHDGSIPTLDSVIRFYENGGGPRETKAISSFELTDQEREDLLFFLKSLTGKGAEAYTLD